MSHSNHVHPQPKDNNFLATFGEGNGNPLQYPCLENPMEGGAWWAPVHSVAKSRTRLSTHTPRTPKQAQKALEKLSTLQVGYKEE